MALGNRLRRARIEAALTQQRVAELANVERNTIWRYEAEVHEPSASILNVLANIYGKPVAWFWEEAETGAAPVETNEPTDPDLDADRELLMNEVDLAFRQVAPELSDEAIRAIAAFIRFTHTEEERERREREGGSL